MTLTFIIASVIFLAATFIGNLLIMLLMSRVDIRIMYRSKNDKAIKRFHTRNLIVGVILQIYYSIFLATMITKYFYDLNDRHKVFLACIIPILLSISLLYTIKKTSKEMILKKWQNGDYNSDLNPTISFWMERRRDEKIGIGALFGLIFFLLYYFFPSFFLFSLKFFFL